MSTVTKACPSCAQTLPIDAAFCLMCGAATPQAIDKATGEIRAITADRIASPDKARLQRALGSNYDLGRLIGRGGFAEVYIVHDRRLKRDLALKALRPDLIISEHLLQRFRREAETVAALRHPHIVPIYDVGEADGVAYLMMPYIQGESLRALLAREGPRPAREACRILLEAADALDAAHDAGVIHRDIKPENIMLEGKGRRAQLMDFGISKAIDTSDSPGLTSTGMLVGTPHYMSPEQAAGEPHLDHRSDQYSLAVVGYQMITGSLPFDGDSTRAVLFQQMVGVPKSLRDLVPDVPAAVAFAIDRALSKEPKERFASMAAFAEAIAGPDAWPLGAGTLDSIMSAPSVEQARATAALAAPAPRPRRWLPAAAVLTVAVAATALVYANMRTATTAPPEGTDSTAIVAAAAATPTATDSVATQQPGTTPAPSPGTLSTAGRPAATAAAPPPAPAALTCQSAFTAERWTDAARVCATEAAGGSATASRRLASLYTRGSGVPKSDSAAAVWYRNAFAAGDASSAFRLGVMYANGVGVTQNDVEATSLLRRAADANVTEAWPVLAERYEQGLGTRRNEQEASFWYRRAAEGGNRAAQFNLGQMYLRGRGVPKSEQDASVWFSRAAEQDHPGAEYELGMMYIRGRAGLAKDEAVGVQWLERAARQGHTEAGKELEKRQRP
ncbi:MAG: protein kinase domain-containing protein [Gemmatimonadales bacterium]